MSAPAPAPTRPLSTGHAAAVAPWLFNIAFALLYVWPVAGAFLDGWAHRRFPGMDTFFTPWHTVLYTGVLAPTAVLGILFLWNQAHGSRARQALPPGYGLSLIGGVMFGVAGLLDLIWHLNLGIEHGFAALLSPTHLLLITSLGLIVTDPCGQPGWPAAPRRMQPLSSQPPRCSRCSASGPSSAIR